MSALLDSSKKIQTERKFITIDGNEAVARVAYRTNEVIAIYPITPASSMGELSDEWASQHLPNLWGTVPTVVEMQSEGGAAGAVHGALQTGALTTTFTASQGLLLMIPNMYKIAAELTPFVLHVAARSLATHALSIFGDHSDVMAARATGFAMLCSNSVQEAHDFALIAQATTLGARVPFVHFFDGFRTSHEVNKIELLSDDVMRAMISDDLIAEHRRRRLAPEHPVIRGTAHNPDTYFQARERINPFYIATIDVLEEMFKRFELITGRRYHLFDYFGAPDAERVVVLMGSGVETAKETAKYLNAQGERVGVVAVRLFRPFSAAYFLEALPKSTKAIAVLDRTKEAGATGEPLYLDVMSALYEGMDKQQLPKVVGGRYGLSSKEFTPAMVKAVFDNLKSDTPKNHFTVGITDDITHTSLEVDDSFSIESDDVVRAVFYGLGADGTVGANKNSIKIIAENTDHYAQGYFVYDSKKSGSMTISHLRFGMKPIHAPYLKLLSQLFGDRAVVANATGCSSIFGGNLPTTPWAKNKDGYGAAWANSLFEDNAEFGYGFRISIDKQREFATELLKAHATDIGENLVIDIVSAREKTEAEIYEQRQRVESLKVRLRDIDKDWAKRLLEIADMLVKKSVWIVGGDGWAYDIGYGGLDHVFSSGKNVNILVLDTEVYSNTGGQASKATPRSAIAKFAASGKAARKKDLGLMAMTYENVYVASVAVGARDEHTLRTFLEAEAYEGVSLIIAYSHCIAHGIEMHDALHHQKTMVDSGQWLLYRYNPELIAKGENPLRLDSKSPKAAVRSFLESENRFKQLEKMHPIEAEKLFAEAQHDADMRYHLYEFLASRKFSGE